MPILSCAACSHVALERLESDVSRGVDLAVIAPRYGLAQTVLEKHLTDCLAPPTPESILAQAVLLQRAALRVLNQALADCDTKTALQAMAAADRGLTTIGKLTGAFAENPLIDARQTNISMILGDMSLSELRALSTNLARTDE